MSSDLLDPQSPRVSSEVHSPRKSSVHELLYSQEGLLANLAVDSSIAQELNAEGVLPLFTACSSNASAHLVRKLIEAFPEALSQPNSENQLPLHLACKHGASVDVVLMLLHANPAALGHKDKQDKLPLTLALESAHHSVADFLIQAAQATSAEPCEQDDTHTPPEGEEAAEIHTCRDSLQTAVDLKEQMNNCAEEMSSSKQRLEAILEKARDAVVEVVPVEEEEANSGVFSMEVLLLAFFAFALGLTWKTQGSSKQLIFLSTVFALQAVSSGQKLLATSYRSPALVDVILSVVLPSSLKVACDEAGLASVDSLLDPQLMAIIVGVLTLVGLLGFLQFFSRGSEKGGEAYWSSLVVRREQASIVSVEFGLVALAMTLSVLSWSSSPGARYLLCGSLGLLTSLLLTETAHASGRIFFLGMLLVLPQAASVTSLDVFM